MDDPNPLSEAGDLSQDMAGHEHCCSLFARQFQEQLADFDDPGWVEPVGWLVQNDEPGIVQQGFC